ncbi:MAG: hypothetical protein ACK4UN_08340, partial [Limisphaerales bacterium]
QFPRRRGTCDELGNSSHVAAEPATSWETVPASPRKLRRAGKQFPRRRGTCDEIGKGSHAVAARGGWRPPKYLI